LKLHTFPQRNKKIPKLYSTPNIIRLIKQKNATEVETLTHVAESNTVSVQNLNVKRHMNNLGVDVIITILTWIERKYDGRI